MLQQLYCIHLKYAQFTPQKVGVQSGTSSWYNNKFGILPCYSLACFISINKEGMKVGCYFQSFAHILPILCLLSYSKARERRRTFYIPPPSMCYSKNKISCLPASFCNVAHTSSLSLHTNSHWSLVEDLQRAENNRFHTLGSFTSSFCVAFCI